MIDEITLDSSDTLFWEDQKELIYPVDDVVCNLRLSQKRFSSAIVTIDLRTARRARDPRSGEPKPETDAPHTELGTQNGSQGKYSQAREFDEKGKPVRDIDFTDHGRPKIHANPHEHPYVRNSTGGPPKRDDGREVVDWEY